SNTVACSYSTAAVENFSIPNAVSGQFYMLMVTNFANLPGQISINQIQGTGAIDCTGMNFTAFLDSNSNGMRDLGEVNFPLGEFHYTKNGGTLHNITSPSGSYGIYDINGSNVYDVSFTVDPSYASNYAVSPSSFMGLSVVPGSGLTEYYFPVSALQNYNDVGVAIIPNQQPRPGLQYTNTIKYTNYGNQTVSGSLSFTHDPLVSISSVSQAGTTPNAAGFSYNYTSLLPFESREIQVTMLVPPIPTVSLGWLLTNTASVASVSGDTVLENNTASSSQIIIGSYDPNDKMESHGGHIAINDFGAGDYLYYTIRFENTGTASAQDVRVYDVLDNSLEPTSVRMVDASHDFTLDRLDNQLTWRFDNINLPFSSSDPAGAKGFVTFKVKPKPGYAVGTVIPNTASIFFDLNPAIVTNTFYTEFVTNLGNESFTANELMIYPNPAGDLVNVSLNGGIIKAIVIYDMLGKKVFDRKAGAASETVDLSGVSPGIYLVEVTDAENQKVIKKLSVK
ncbi:MAG: T9SS type A sorting domain-containing protein, partial [Flavobacterium sp.]